MKNTFMVFTYLVALTYKLLRRGGMKALVSENLLLYQTSLMKTGGVNLCPNGIVQSDG
jgi:hypothetical protein